MQDQTVSIVVGSDDHVQWRFVPKSQGRDVIVTPRRSSYPPIPIGARLLQRGVYLGTVGAVVKTNFERYQVRLTDVPSAEADPAVVSDESPSADNWQALPLEKAGLSSRIVGALHGAGLVTVGDVVAWDGVLTDIDGIGAASAADIIAAMAEYEGAPSA